MFQLYYSIYVYFFLISCSKYPGKLNNEIEKEKTEVHRNESDRDSNYWTEEKMDKAEPPDIREK